MSLTKNALAEDPASTSVVVNELTCVARIPFFPPCLLLTLLALQTFLPTITRGAETNDLPKPAPPVIRHAAMTPIETAAQHERAGRKKEAAALYEEIARTNTVARKVLSHRLVTIYTESGETNKALAWASEVMKDNPDPQAYLAGVNERLGQTDKAQEILQREIAGNTNSMRAITLRWQFADLCYKTGDSIKARVLLTEAVTAASGTAMETAARRRLGALTEPERALIEKTPK